MQGLFLFLLGFAWFYLDLHMRKTQRAETRGWRAYAPITAAITSLSPSAVWV
jgi:hypothetical protein